MTTSKRSLRNLCLYATVLCFSIGFAGTQGWSQDGRFVQIPRPNIVLLYADDLGWSDLSCYGGDTSTPHIDRLAEEGVRFTDAHSVAATGTSSRFSMLTGVFSWRHDGRENGDAELAIDPHLPSMASIMRSAGYYTAVIGPPGLSMSSDVAHEKQTDVLGPIDVLFNESWVTTDANLPNAPDDGVVTRSDPLREAIPRTQTPDRSTEHAIEYLSQRSRDERPFFLWYALEPSADVGRLDATVGKILEHLDALTLSDKTLVIFTSDNGSICEVDSKRTSHQPSTHAKQHPSLRGGKYSAFEGGSRVPMLVRWPGEVVPGSVSGAMICHVDFPACFASIAGETLEPGQCPDSQDVTEALAGRDPRGRWLLVKESSTLSIRHANWKYIEPREGPGVVDLVVDQETKHVETGLSDKAQLFDLALDLDESNNLAAKHPDIVKNLKKLLELFQDENH